MAITLITNTPKFTLPRGYLRGFNFVSNVVNLRFEGTTIRFQGANPDLEFYIEVYPNAFPFSTTAYSLDVVIDWDASVVTLFGLPTPGGIIASVDYAPNEFERRIFLQTAGDFSSTNLIDLPAPPSTYWYPISP